MKGHKKILAFIKVIRESFHDSTLVYRYGACYGFFLILKTVFPGAKPFFISDKSDHIVTKIGNRFYDIKGVCQIHTDDHPTPLTAKDREYWVNVAAGQRLEYMIAKYEERVLEIKTGKK